MPPELKDRYLRLFQYMGVGLLPVVFLSYVIGSLGYETAAVIWSAAGGILVGTISAIYVSKAG